MKSIIIAYPIKNTALQIRSVLEEQGLYVSHICATGASVLNIANDMREGIIVCSSFLRDMGAGALAERLPAGFDIVALSKSGTQEYMGNMVTLPLPLDRDEFVGTVLLLASSQSSYTRRTKDDDDVISTAKSLLMNFNSMSEMQAHKYLQQQSMKTGKKLVEMATEIINDLT